MKLFLSVSSLSQRYLEKENIEAKAMLSSITSKHPKISKAAEFFFPASKTEVLFPSRMYGNGCL